MNRNAKGYRIGESHHMAKLSDHEVELIRDLRDEGVRVKALAEKFEVSTFTIEDIIYFRKRNQYPE